MTEDLDAYNVKVELGHIVGQLSYGCGNAGCRIRRPLGMRTNGPCQCSPRRLAARLLEVAAVLEKMPVDKFRIED